MARLLIVFLGDTSPPRERMTFTGSAEDIDSLDSALNSCITGNRDRVNITLDTDEESDVASIQIEFDKIDYWRVSG